VFKTGTSEANNTIIARKKTTNPLGNCSMLQTTSAELLLMAMSGRENQVPLRFSCSCPENEVGPPASRTSVAITNTPK